MTVTAVVCSHANPDGLRAILGCLRYQSVKPDETIALVSDTPDLARLREEFPDVEFLERPDRADWGHEKRAEGLQRATMEWVGFFNDDDSYTRDYLETMLAAGRAADVVYCGWNEHPDCGFHGCSSTAGNFLVRTRVAQRVGWNGRHYQADAEFIEALNIAGVRIARVDRLLYTHNADG